MGDSPDITQGSAFGTSPMATPPFLSSQGGTPSPQGAAAPTNDMTQKILQALAQAAQRKTMQNTAVPSAIPGFGDPEQARQIGMNTGNPNAWGAQRFSAGLGVAIKNAVAKEKQGQLLKAEGDWNYLQSSMNELFVAQQSGDPAAIKAAQQKVDVILADPKKLKNMAKALNQDWLNPEKTTVYGEALKNVMKQTDQKEQAKQGLKGMIQKLLGQKQALQREAAMRSLTDQQKEQMAREIEGKAPATTGSPDLKDATRIAEEQMKEEAAAKRQEAKEAADLKKQQDREEFETKLADVKERNANIRQQNHESFERSMKSLEEFGRDERQNAQLLAMLQATGMRVSAEDKRYFHTEEKDREKAVNDAAGSLHKQLAEAQTQLKSFNTSASNKWFGQTRMKDEIESAQSEVDNLKKAVDYLDRNRDAIIKGKKDMGEVVNKAYDLMGGGAGETPPPPPGFVPAPAGKP